MTRRHIDPSHEGSCGHERCAGGFTEDVSFPSYYQCAGRRTEQIELVVSTAILLEYQEILTRKTNASVATNFLEFLLKLPGVVRVDTPFTWGIIEIDVDDNKFVDAGLMGGADYIVTYDGHFEVVKERPFPTVGVITPDEFLTMLDSLKSQ